MNDSPDSETRARVDGIESQIKRFGFYFGASLLCNVLSHTDNLSKTLQHTSMSAAEGQHLVNMTVKTLHSIRTDDMFRLFLERIIVEASSLNVSDPTLPRLRKIPRRYNDAHGTEAIPPYFETLDTIVSCISERFHQEGYLMYCKLEQ